MPTVDLSTTNLLLGIMAAVSVLQGLVLIGAGVAGFLAYKRVTQLVTDLEARQIAPLREKVEAILGDVKTVTARVSQQTERVDSRDLRHDGPGRRDRGAGQALGDGQGQSGDAASCAAFARWSRPC